ncbi:hypothetical protein [Nitrincola alkalisediminis]|uniref:hypothetical protein n=1 Tax=Nitrincola alkalisediminis TaxID=1366656 RepID=UPI001873CB5C|nr:hypothetical protein [Nitrincola alkalisediminis]
MGNYKGWGGKSCSLVGRMLGGFGAGGRGVSSPLQTRRESIPGASLSPSMATDGLEWRQHTSSVERIGVFWIFD